jgi:hypothetical protein
MNDINEDQSPLAKALGLTLSQDNKRIENAAAAELKIKADAEFAAKSRSEQETANTHNDAEFARQTIYEMVQKNNEAIDQLLNISRESMHPRSFEVLAGMIRHNADIAEKLLIIRADKQKVQNNAINLVRNEQAILPPPQSNNSLTQIVNIDKAVFTGSTAELLEMVRTAAPTVLLDQTGADEEEE